MFAQSHQRKISILLHLKDAHISYHFHCQFFFVNEKETHQTIRVEVRHQTIANLPNVILDRKRTGLEKVFHTRYVQVHLLYFQCF